MGFFKGLYEYRELLKTSISKDVRGKYKNSILGVMLPTQLAGHLRQENVKSYPEMNGL